MFTSQSSTTSPMAKPPSMLNIKKRASSSSLSKNKLSATEALAAVFQKNAERAATRSPTPTPTSTPALSYYSGTTTTVSEEVEEIETTFDEDGLSFPPSHAAPGSEHNAFTTRHSEFGHCVNNNYRHLSQHTGGPIVIKENEPPQSIIIPTYISYLLLIVVGHIRDFFGKIFFPESYVHLVPHNGYAALNSDFDSFYTRRLKLRIDDCFSRPVTGVPGRTITLLDRVSDNCHETFRLTGTKTRALNVSSYNYLGFAQGRGGCADAVEEAIRRYGISALGSRLDGGSLDLHTTAEGLVARFLGQEDALITSMGFATNSTNIPALVGKGCLIISDELNHASIRFGARLSGASIRMFKHNDMKDLERLLREVISQGQPRTHRPWKKILLIIEGLYSMEGTMCDLPSIVALKKRYKFYIFLDEAHSVGALGSHGRGVIDYFGIDPRSVDLCMGTFTKSFGAAGGYVAGRKEFIARLRLRSHASMYAEAMTPAVLTQIMASMGSIMGIVPTPKPTSSSTSTVTLGNSQQQLAFPGPAPESALPPWLTLPTHMYSGAEGSERLQRLAFNCRYLHRALKKLGFITYGHPSSPICVLLLFGPAKMSSFSRLMLQRKTPIVVVVVGYPATPLTLGRVRFCLSAAHTKEDVDTVLEACNDIGEWLDLKRGCPRSERWSLDEIKKRAVELVQME